MSRDHVIEETGILAWCFLPCDSRWRRHDPWGNRLLITAGKTFTASDMVEMRRRHFDVWESPLDALRHAAGLIACRVRLSDTIERVGFPRYYRPITAEGVGRIERLYANEFHVLWTADVAFTIHRFTCDLAARLLERERTAGREPDERAWAVVIARQEWLEGRLRDEEMQRVWTAFEAARRQQYQQRPPIQCGIPYGGIKHVEWSTHAGALMTVETATKPVPFTSFMSVENAKRVISSVVRGTLLWPPEGRSEQRIEQQMANLQVMNADLDQRLNDAYRRSI